jgi:hypothetical protein
MSMPPRRHPARVAAAVLAVAAALGLSACGGGSSTSGSAAMSTSSVQHGAADSLAGGAVGAPAKEGSVAGSSGSAAVDPNVTKAAQSAASAQLLARTASMSMQVKNLNEAAARARGAALAAGGQVTQENLQTGSNPDPTPVPLGQEGTAQSTQQPIPEGSGTMILQVPGDKLDATLDTLSRIGTVAERQISTEDVTGQVVDTQARLATMKESVARVRALMSQATKLADIVTLESEVSRRQADLESLEAQLSSLNGRVAMSPITLTFWTTTPPAATEKKSTGFIGGLKSGWHAFTVATNVIVTAIGALLPFAILAAVVGIPLLAWSRKRRAARAVPPPPSAMRPPTDPNPPTDPPAPVDPTAPAPAEPVNA